MNSSFVQRPAVRRRAEPPKSKPKPQPKPKPKAKAKARAKAKTKRTAAVAFSTTGSSTLWSERFAPLCVADLAVHKARIDTLREWLSAPAPAPGAAAARGGRLLILHGASGVGKSTTVRLLASELGMDVAEWKGMPAGNIWTERGSECLCVIFRYSV